ncbi:MAG: tRNA 2-thiouridine(34) synthase MnmA [Cryomorphaceae bacterium]|nr:MAG: tRNA 2-thiouridine(34) synthase MnmA [Cryomorphaceae bacterium]
MKRVVVGLSGGVDSSVAAYLLQEQGYEVIGLFMRNWHNDDVTISKSCPWIEDSNDAMLVAQRLGIPFQVIDLSEEYKSRIVDYMFAEYEAGRTPNPDVLCNREIKFDPFLKAAGQLGADYIATGHYCRREETELNGNKVYRLLAGKDPNKDQSYFLCQLSQEQLSRALFPIGHLMKSEVRDIARSLQLETAEKKDSQGLCFVGKVRLPEFLQQQLQPKKGNIIEVMASHPQYNISVNGNWQTLGDEQLLQAVEPWKYVPEDGEVVGEHSGAHYFTIGQRKGLAVGGKAEPLFVIDTDTGLNVIYTGQSDQHPGLYRRGLFVPAGDVHWIRPDLALRPGESRTYDCRIRYRQPLERAHLYCREEGMYIVFEHTQRGVARGQFAAWYNGEELIGSGVIGG